MSTGFTAFRSVHTHAHNNKNQTLKLAINDYMYNFPSGIYKKMRGEESRLSENSQGIEKVKQQHYIQEDKVCPLLYTIDYFILLIN